MKPKTLQHGCPFRSRYKLVETPVSRKRDRVDEDHELEARSL